MSADAWSLHGWTFVVCRAANVSAVAWQGDKGSIYRVAQSKLGLVQIECYSIRST